MDRASSLLSAVRYGAWIRTKAQPFRAVVWVPDRHPDGRQTLRGRRWEEVLSHSDYLAGREPDRFFTDDVDVAGPMEYISYAPASTARICGYQVTTGQWCARQADAELFCDRHEAEFAAESGEDQA